MTSSGPTPSDSPHTPPEPDATGDPVDTDTGTTEDDKPEPTLLEQMGGVSGLVYSSVPVLVFVGVYLPTYSLAAAIWASLGSAVAILIWRIVRKDPVQPAISGIFGVAVAAFIAYRTGSARGYFLFGIWTSLTYGGVFLVSVLVRWPLAGAAWSLLNGTGMGWRSDKLARRYYDVATVVWVVVFGARFVVQHWLYTINQVGWLGVARIGMGWPLTAVAALVTVWAVRKADQRQKALAGAVEEVTEQAVTEQAEEPAPVPDA